MESNYNPFSNSPEGDNQNQNTNQNPYHFNPYGQQQFQPMQKKPLNFFEAASMVLAIGALISCTCFYGSYIMGAMAILFALLSRGGQMKLSSKAKLGLIVGILAIVLSTVVTIGAFYIAIEEYGSIEAILREYCEMYGLDFEKEFGNLFQ